MGRMNWDRVNRQNRAWRSYDYTASMDAADEAVAIEVAVTEGVGERSIMAKLLRDARRPSEPGTTTPAAGEALSKAEEKRLRDQREARRLGISIPELKSRRRAEALANLELHGRATALGISVKELRSRSR